MQDYKEKVVHRRRHCSLLGREVAITLTYRRYKLGRVPPQTYPHQFDCEDVDTCGEAKEDSRWTHCPLREDFSRGRLT